MYSQGVNHLILGVAAGDRKALKVEMYSSSENDSATLMRVIFTQGLWGAIIWQETGAKRISIPEAGVLAVLSWLLQLPDPEALANISS